MKSPEKIRTLYDQLVRREPQSAQEAIMLLAARQLGPSVLDGLPSDPDELDELLGKFSEWVLSMRSDIAAPNEAEPVAT